MHMHVHDTFMGSTVYANLCERGVHRAPVRHYALFGALWSDFQAPHGQPLRDPMGNGSLWVAAAFGRGSTRGHPYRLAVTGSSPWFDPRGPFPPVLPEYCVGLGTARRRQLVEAGAGLPVRGTTARAQPLAAAATQVCVTPQRGCEGCPPGLRPRLPLVPSTCRRAVGDTCGNSDRQGKRAGRAWGPRARSPAKAQALRGAGL